MLANLLLIFLLGFSPLTEPATQKVRPVQLARQLESEQAKLREAFDRDISGGHAQPDDWDDRLLPLVKRATEQVAGFKLSDWQGEELYALGTILFFARQYDRALEAFRSFIKADETGKGVTQAGMRVVRALIELDRIDEAAAALEGVAKYEAAGYEMVAFRVGAHRDIAAAYRDAQQYEKAAKQAVAGFDLAGRIPPRAWLPLSLRDVRDFDPARLAALAVSLLEHLGFKQAAEDMQRRWRSGERGRTLEVQGTFEMELANGRLIGRPVPEIAARSWIDSSPLTWSALRGKVVLLHFWAMWNSSSTNPFGRLNEWELSYQERGLRIIGVTRLFGRSDREDGLTAVQEMKSLESFKLKEHVAFPFAVAGLDDIANDERFGVNSMPSAILVDRQGRVRAVKRGASDYRKLTRQLDKLTAEP